MTKKFGAKFQNECTAALVFSSDRTPVIGVPDRPFERRVGQ
jgi:hypothetical protein